MCGILLHIGEEKIERDHPALNIINHRGPDDCGAINFSLDNFNIGMGHRRLSIIDLTKNGHQPMSYENKSLWIVFNGEIYNYLEIRIELKKYGYSFISDSDTEVLLAAYSHWGTECLKHLNGMFAFTLYDKKNNSLFIVRDRFGIKPIYYYNSSKGLTFFSEIKQITKFKHFSPKVNKTQLYHFLNSGDFNFSEETLWNEIYTVPEGSYALIDLNIWKLGQKISFTQWYSPIVNSLLNISFDDAVVEFRRLLDQAVALRLRADVPIGFLLSGGLDSSTLVGLAYNNNKYEKKHLKTYSTCYDDKNLDERKYINAVTDFAQSQSYLHFPQPDDIFNCLDKVIWHNDLPILPGSPCSHWLLYKHITQEMDSRKVMIEGQGADEILCGYGDFQFASMFEKMKLSSFPSFIRELINYEFHFKQSPKILLRKFRRLIFPNSVKYPANSVLNTDFLLDSDIIPSIPVKREEQSVQALHQNRMIILRYILHYVDRDSMSHSKETRVPFLDHNLVEFCLRLPTNFKISKGFSKLVMRKAVGDILPDIVKNRTDKMGYSSPTAKWIQSDLKEVFKKEIGECYNLPFVREDVLKVLLEGAVQKGAYFDPILWRLMTVKRWIKLFKVEI